jgi:hypothetical protein
LRRLIQFFSRNIKKLIRLAKRNNIDQWFEDECHFQQHGSRCVMWIPSDVKDPITLHAPTRKHIGILGRFALLMAPLSPNVLRRSMHIRFRGS